MTATTITNRHHNTHVQSPNARNVTLRLCVASLPLLILRLLEGIAMCTRKIMCYPNIHPQPLSNPYPPRRTILATENSIRNPPLPPQDHRCSDPKTKSQDISTSSKASQSTGIWSRSRVCASVHRVPPPKGQETCFRSEAAQSILTSLRVKV